MTNKTNVAINKAVDLLIDNDTDVSTLFKGGGLLKQLIKRFVEKALQSEMNNHLLRKYNRMDTDNVRNGVSTKNLITDNGVILIEVPRGRDSKFVSYDGKLCMEVR